MTLSFLHFFKKCQQVLPQPFGGSNFQSFPAGMDVLHIGANGHAVKIRQLFGKKATFQACVNRHHFRGVSIHFLIGFHHLLPQGRFLPVLPGRIFPLFAISCAEEPGTILQLIQQRPFFLLYAAADREGQLQAVL